MAGRISQIIAAIKASPVADRDASYFLDLFEGAFPFPHFPGPVDHHSATIAPGEDFSVIEASLFAPQLATSAVNPSIIKPPAGPTSGDDTLTGTAADNTINGLGGNDTMSGLGGNDTLAGNAGADTIDGGDGNDVIYAGDVSPPFTYPGGGASYTPPLFDSGTEVDTLKVGLGDDTLSAGYGDNVDGGDGTDTLFINFQQATSGIHFDMSLTTQVIGGGTITNIEGVSWLQGSNYDDYVNLDNPENSYFPDGAVVFGMGGNDTLIAGYYTYLLDGGDGNDILDGRAGQYLAELDGGAGDDTIYANGASLPVANGGDGNDTIYAAVEAHGGAGNDTIIVENGEYLSTVTGDGGDDNITGNYGDDYLSGNDGNDTLHGGAGNDVIDGGAGVDIISGDLGGDVLTGGADNDIFQFGQGDGPDTITDFATGDVVQVNGYDEAQSITQNGSDVIVVFSNDDQITFQNASVATVTAGLHFMPPTDDTIVGTDGNDFLRGFGGNDTINGNGGYDTLVGGSGADTLNGGGDGDALYSGDVVPQDYQFDYQGHYVAPQLDNGSEQDTLIGGGGDDVIFAGYGDNVDGGSDGSEGDKLFISFQGASAGIHFDGHLTTQTIGGGTITGIENISWVQGSNFDDYIDVGTAHNNGYSDFTVLQGLGGNDTLIAGYYTSAVDGGDGNDTIDGRASGYIDDIFGGAGDDVIYAPGNGSVITYGGDGNDTISSAGETHGGAGNDTITVGIPYFGSTQVTGDEGNDTIVDGAGSDILDGGSGDDLLTGGAGHDTFIVGDGNDVVTDLSAGDKLEIHAGFSASGINQVGSDVVINLSNGNILTLQNTTVSAVSADLRANANDTVISPDSSTIYTTGDDGNLYAYDASTGDLLQAWHIGTDLGAIDISPDGAYAMVTELVPLVSHADPNYWTDNQFTVTVYKVDLSTGHVTSYPLDVTGANYSFYDVAILADGTAIVSESILPGWSGGGRTLILDPDTGAYTEQSFGGQNTVLSSSSNGQFILGGPKNESDAPLLLYRSGQGLLATHSVYDDGGYGYNAGVQAVSDNGQLVAQAIYGEGINIYDSQLHLVANLGVTHPEWTNGEVSGVAFDSTGQYLFVLDNQTDSIVKLSTTDWSVVATYAVGADVSWNGGGFGNGLLVAPDMSYFTVMTGSGWVEVVPPMTPATTGNDVIDGTVRPDTINGLAGDDVIHGLGGNDILSGGAGNDLLDGGAGVDTASYASAASGVTVSLAIAGPQNTGGPGMDTLTSIENLTGSAYADTLTGDGGANTIIGGAGNDVLSGAAGTDSLDGGNGNDHLAGGADNDMITGGIGNDVLDGGIGADAMAGGAGSDTYWVDNVGDTVTENSGEGTDTVHSGLSWTLGANVENLVLAGTAAIDGTGNALANSITGNAGDNHLSGLDGNDMLSGLGGNDTLDGGVGADHLLGGDGNDSLTGGDDNDLLEGGAGADSMLGGIGNDTLKGGSGNDTLDGGAGRDTLNGGTGADQFVFHGGDTGATGATADVIYGFSSAEGDKVNLQAVDANSLLGGDQAFSFIGTDTFHHVAGELRYQESGGNTFVYADLDGDGHADLAIMLGGTHALTSGDFLL